MNRFHVATLIGVVVTMVLASRVIALRASRRPGPGWLAKLRFDIEWFLRSARNRIDDWIAASIARRERDVAIPMLHDSRERELSAPNPDLGCIDGCCAQQDCLAKMTDLSATPATMEKGR